MCVSTCMFVLCISISKQLTEPTTPPITVDVLFSLGTALAVQSEIECHTESHKVHTINHSSNCSALVHKVVCS